MPAESEDTHVSHHHENGETVDLTATDKLLEVQFHNIAIGNKMVRTDLLTVEYFGTPYTCELQALGYVFVHHTSNIMDRATAPHREGLIAICLLSGLLGIDTHYIQSPK